MDISYPDYVKKLVDSITLRHNSGVSHINGRSLAEIIPSVIFFITLDLMCIFGNVLVVFSVKMYPQLNCAQNYLIVSLAFTDMTCAILLMPCHILTYLHNGNWIFGIHMCRIFVFWDITLCTASIVNLCAISFDRFLSLKQPIEHESRRTNTFVLCVILCVWILSFLTSSPLYALNINEIYQTIHISSNRKQSICRMSPNKIFVIFSSSLSFYIPAIFICYINLNIYILTISRLRARRHYNTRLIENANKCSTTASTDQALTSLQAKEKYARAKEKRLTLTLLTIVTSFIICWAPFFVLYLIEPFIGINSIPERIQDIALWLGYLNSATNPLIYSLCNMDFRKAFIGLLKVATCQTRRLAL